MNEDSYSLLPKLDHTEPEVLVPVTCPICSCESLAGFRYSVIVDALETRCIRLYVDCHVASWDGSPRELAAIRDYLDTVWGTGLHAACEEFFTLDQFLDSDSLSFIYTGVIGAADRHKPRDGSSWRKTSLVKRASDTTISMSFSRRAFKGHGHRPVFTGLTQLSL